ncbi:MAG: hypothetical protein WC789_02055 [Lentisphaeria bacterium]
MTRSVQILALAAGVAAAPPAQAEPPAPFEPSPRGFIRHWLVAGPHEARYAGPPGPEHRLRQEALDPATATPPATAALAGPGPFGLPWRFHDPGRNEFVEFSTFYKEPTVVNHWAFTEIVAPMAGEWPARLWAAGAADLWVNGRHLARLNVTRYRNPDFQPLALPLHRGRNRLCVRLQCLGIRDTRILFGLALADPAGVTVPMPGAAPIAQALRWLDTVRAPRPDGLAAAGPAPFAARVLPAAGEPSPWPAGSSNFIFAGARPAELAVETTVALEPPGAAATSVTLRRNLEIPANRPPPPPTSAPGDRRTAHLRYIAKAGVGDIPKAAWNAGILPLLARRLLGQATDQDAAAFAEAIAMVDARRDCADFLLAGLLRLELLRLANPAESAEIRRAALAFRYWSDEPGNDAMCFWSENHSLLFHGCQLLAGRLYPDEVFPNSGRTGREQAALALPRIRHWLETVEARGFEEFNSSTYMPITVAAMLNVVDFAGDPGLAKRMAAQVDRIFADLAQHAFAGGVVSPQGRVYRDVLFPEDAGTQALLAFATAAADCDLAGRRTGARTGDWVAFLASSPAYRPPANLAVKVAEPVSRTYRHADFQIILEKTPAYILASLAVPAVPRPGEQPENDLRPGGSGYQQHLWQATLGRGCHVFVNHPGGFFDGTLSRPGYWHGNGVLPRVRQQGNWLQAIHVIPDGRQTKPAITPEAWQWPSASSVRPFALHPVAFTHAHWPADAFDREERRGNWLFGQKGRGLIGLWCSEPLVPHDDVLTGRELRANGHVSAWLVVCGDLEREGTLEAFMAACQARGPAFDRGALTLAMTGATPTRWWERSEPMPE